MLVYNPTTEKQSVQVFGNWFSFAPGQIKNLQDQFAVFIRQEKKYTGLVVLPEAFEDEAYKDTEAGKEALAKAKSEGIGNYVEFHKKIVANNQVSLRQDLEKANIKADPLTFASAGELESLRIVAKYQKAEADEAQAKVDEMKKLLKEIGKK